MFLSCARIYIGGVKLVDVKNNFPNARKIAGRIYVGYDNATGLIFNKADALANQLGGYVESEAD